MTCPRCQIDYNSLHWGACPHCGHHRENEGHGADLEGVIKTSTILISTDDGGVFRTIEELPQRLRETLISCTGGANSATIVIADQGGRARIASALRNLPAEPTYPPVETTGVRQSTYARLCGRVPVLWWAGILVAGFAGAFTWLVISHLP
jgi:hypothetical protein